MPTTEDDIQARAPGIPVVKRQEIGHTFRGAFVKQKQRDRTKDGRPILKPDGKHKQEMVVHCVVMPGTTTPAGLGDDIVVPAPGHIVRLVLTGLSFSHWIDQTKALRGVKRAGDVVEFTLTTAQAFDSDGKPKGSQITDQADVLALRMRGATVGVYGDLTVRPTTTGELPWANAANEALATLTAGPTTDDASDDEDPF
jgi:hypothetical protein